VVELRVLDIGDDHRLRLDFFVSSILINPSNNQAHKIPGISSTLNIQTYQRVGAGKSGYLKIGELILDQLSVWRMASKLLLLQQYESHTDFH
jgi:hypothetical protein